MHKALATGVDELGFRLIHVTLRLHERRHRPDATALDTLRREGSPIVPPGLGAPPPPEVTIETVSQPRWLDPDARLSFPSPRPCAHDENNTVHIDLYRPGNSWGSGIVLGCPGVLTGAAGINEWPFRWWARAVSRRGLTFGLVHPPYHMRRTPKGHLSGELMFSGDVFTVAEGFNQSAYDLKAAVSWALTVSPRVGYWGASMGGVMGLLLATCEPRLHCCIPMIPAADLSGPMFRSTLCQVMREDFIGAGGTAADLHALMAPLDPFKRRPAIARDRLLLIEAMYDRVCYPEELEQLWAAWDHPPIMRYPHGHLSIFRSGDCMRNMGEYLQTYLTGPALPAPAITPQLAEAT